MNSEELNLEIVIVTEMKLNIVTPNIYKTKLYRKIKAKNRNAWANYLNKKLDKYEQR